MSLYQTTAKVSDEKHIEQNIVALWPDQWSDEFLYAAAVQLSDKESDNEMIASEVSTPLLSTLVMQMLYSSHHKEN